MTDKLEGRIRAGGYGRKELENLYANAERLGNARVLNAAKEALRQVDAKSFAKRFVKPIRVKVEEIAREIAWPQGWTRFEDNEVGDGVKPGGSMLTGEELAEFYISYRHPTWKRSSYLAVFQHDEQGPVLYKVRSHDGIERVVQTSDEAVEIFRNAVQTT